MAKKRDVINACYKCRYRGTLPGNRHSRCTHPNKNDIEVIGDKYGKSQGWFMWPFNFDPTWLVSCSGFKQKEG